MFDTILLPTDFSADSARVLNCVPELPGTQKIILLHVIDATHPSRRGWEHGPQTENAKILIGESKRTVEQSGAGAGFGVETIVNTITQGDIAHAILEHARAAGAGLIVMGARGKNTIQNILLGSVSANVIRRATIPVLLMRSSPGSCPSDRPCAFFSRVLVPVDFSDPSRNALGLLKKIPGCGQVILLHVVDKGESESEVHEAVGAAQQKLAAIRDELVAAGINSEARVHVGYPPDEITATAERDDVSLILMSPQGEGWMREIKALFVGSTTNAVIRRAKRPVLIAAGHHPA